MSNEINGFQFKQELSSEIENIVYKLKNSISPDKIASWLKNFEEEHLNDALDFLLFFEFITSSELQLRLNEQLENILVDVKLGDKIVVFPYGKKGKSGTLITYFLRNTLAFKKREKDFEITWDLSSINYQQDYVLLMIDDFIGSANTFITEYKENILPIADRLFYLKDKFLLAAIIMNNGKKAIKRSYSDVSIHAEVRHKIFDPILSPFNNLPNKVDHYRIINHTYGIKIRVGRKPNFLPLGYDDSESYLAFAHTTPNNTLPIIWGDNGWNPLYPRFAQKRMEEASELKKDVKFYMNILNRFGMFIDRDVIIRLKGGNIKKYNSKTDHSLLLLLKLKIEKSEDLIVCQTLGITMKDLNVIYKHGVEEKYFDSEKQITQLGYDFYKELIKLARSKRPRVAKKVDFDSKKNVFLPNNFRGRA